MNIPGFSTNGLLMMHGGIRDALAVDDNTGEDHEKPFGVREYADWRPLGDALEAELGRRKVTYTKIPW